MATEIEKTAQEIEQECENFMKIYRDLIEKGENLEIEFKDRLEKTGEALKEFFAKSKAIEEAWRLNKTQFGEGRIGKDGYERRFIELTEKIIRLKFDFRFRMRIEIERFDRRVNASLRNRGVPSTLPPVGQELKLDITDEEKEKVEAVARSMDETREKLGEVGVKETFGSPETYIRLGIFNIETKNFEKAKEYFERALEIDPELATAWRNLGWAHSKLGDHKQAIKYSEKALEIDPKYATAWNDLGQAHSKLGNYKQAIKYSEKALEIDPKYATAWNNLGWAHSELGDHKQAIKHYEKALEIDQKLATAWINLGWAHDELGHQEEAKRCFKKAMELGDP